MRLHKILYTIISWKYNKKKYEQIAQKEIDSVVNTFMKEAVPTAESKNEVTEQADYTKIVQKYDHDADQVSITEEEDDQVPMKKPYIITPEEFGGQDEYETVTLTYYADGILEDEEGNIVDKGTVDDLIGLGSLKHFGEYEADSVFVRNDKLKIDYEILADRDPYPDT